MKRRYDRSKHRRRSIRLKGWDYTTPGTYFVTICTYQLELLFEDSRLGEIAENAWRNIPRQLHARCVALDEWVVMPNHLHGILILSGIEGDGDSSCRGEAGRKGVSDGDGCSHRPASLLPGKLPTAGPAIRLAAGSVGAILGNFKSLVTSRINNLRQTPGGRVWQHGYYDRIVRDERMLAAVRRYIRENSARWEEDRENLEEVLARMEHQAGR